MIKLALVGARGRMGKTIETVLDEDSRFGLLLPFDKDNARELPTRANEADVILDVSAPKATIVFLKQLSDRGTHRPYVIGCTGWTKDQLQTVRRYAQGTCVVLAPNFAPGVNIFLELVEKSSALLKKWGYKAAIHEIHHAKKVDAPSGTAKAIVERMQKYKPQIKSTRTGNVVGTHEVRFAGKGDVITLVHEALDRKIFARGALEAAAWAANHSDKGLFSMREVLFGSSGF